MEDAKALMLEAELTKTPREDSTEFFLEAVLEVKRNVEVIEQSAHAAEERLRFRMPDPFARYERPQGPERPPNS